MHPKFIICRKESVHWSAEMIRLIFNTEKCLRNSKIEANPTEMQNGSETNI